MSTVLNLLHGLLELNDSSSICEVTDTSVSARNISEAAFKTMTLPVNNPAYNGNYSFAKLEVFLSASGQTPHLFPTQIFGLHEILSERVKLSETTAFAASSTTHTPFIAFKDNKSMSTMIDTLSVLSKGTVCTTPFVKTYAIHFVLDDAPQSSGMAPDLGGYRPGMRAPHLGGYRPGMWAPHLGGYSQGGASRLSDPYWSQIRNFKWTG